ncbi:hypothetical protein H4S07_002934 [Coemansia furcata]|uniref:Uncharacterized protein n=1 Tax=Coemansia furcata TaxID=417177 RepID=A0ACC1LJZ8_9FUNG|nr:hypothetical protein H4S07_002934 [Coemansia furcata]
MLDGELLACSVHGDQLMLFHFPENPEDDAAWSSCLQEGADEERLQAAEASLHLAAAGTETVSVPEAAASATPEDMPEATATMDDASSLIDAASAIEAASTLDDECAASIAGNDLWLLLGEDKAVMLSAILPNQTELDTGSDSSYELAQGSSSSNYAESESSAGTNTKSADCDNSAMEEHDDGSPTNDEDPSAEDERPQEGDVLEEMT